MCLNTKIDKKPWIPNEDQQLIKYVRIDKGFLFDRPRPLQMGGTCITPEGRLGIN